MQDEVLHASCYESLLWWVKQEEGKRGGKGETALRIIAFFGWGVLCIESRGPIVHLLVSEVKPHDKHEVDTHAIFVQENIYCMFMSK